MSFFATIRMWIIYKHPSDYPNHYVVREYLVDEKGPKGVVRPFLAPTLDIARKAVPPGSVNLGREPMDDPVIVESWI